MYGSARPRALATTLAAAALVALIADAPAFGQPEGQSPPQLPPARVIPGITAPDMFPGACVSCHLNYTEQNLDVRFSTLMKEWNNGVSEKLLAQARAAAPAGVTITGKHPQLGGDFSDVPGDCLLCHDAQSTTAPPFARMLHKIHLTGGQENHFLTLFQGECTHCHKLDTADGRWSIPSGPEQ